MDKVALNDVRELGLIGVLPKSEGIQDVICAREIIHGLSQESQKITHPSLSSRSLRPIFPRINLYDCRLNQILSRQAVITKIDDNFEWVEGPVWNPRDQYLLFSDIPRNSIFKWKEGGDSKIFLHPSGYTGRTVFRGKEPGSNGLTYDNEGNLYMCRHGDRQIVRIDTNGDETVIADSYEGRRLNSPNDLVFKSTGELYFTDPPYGLPLRQKDPEKELPFSGIYRVKDGIVELLSSELSMPNGIAFSPDERFLYVSNSAKQEDGDFPSWYRFEVKEDGTLANKELFYNGVALTSRNPGSPDGLKVDQRGNLFCAGPGGIYIFAPDKTLLGMIEFGERTSNCAWGNDGSHLYITANHAVYRLETKSKGAGFSWIPQDA